MEHPKECPQCAAVNERLAAIEDRLWALYRDVEQDAIWRTDVMEDLHSISVDLGETIIDNFGVRE
ncbi:MAG: hypothetical protein ACYTEQ_19660 [Planctomycetota bacterium]|jgi:hypothetical protein